MGICIIIQKQISASFLPRYVTVRYDRGMPEAVKRGEAQLLDVRTLPEWQESHAKGALFIPLARLTGGEESGLDMSKPIYIYCASGARAVSAATHLSARGYTAQSVGGLRAWLSLGGELA